MCRNRDKQRRRDRVLSMEELRAVWDAAGGLGYPWGPCYRLILLTGDRRGEWARARWDWLVADLTRLEIPASEYKTSKSQVVPLSAQARTIIAHCPWRGRGAPVLERWWSATISGFSKARARLDPLIVHRLGHPLSPWVVHDLRRSMATHLQRIGVEPHIIEVCLGHALKGVAGPYRQYGYLPEKARALQVWADELLAARGDDLGACARRRGHEVSAPRWSLYAVALVNEPWPTLLTNVGPIRSPRLSTGSGSTRGPRRTSERTAARRYEVHVRVQQQARTF